MFSPGRGQALGQALGQVLRGLVSPMGLRGTTWDCGTRRFSRGIVLQRSIPPRHGTAPGHGSGALDVDEAGLSATSPKLRETAVPGCALQGGAARFRRISPTHVGMVPLDGPQSLLPTHVGMDLVPERCRENLQRLPHACGDPRLGV